MGINPITASKNIVDKYLAYIETTFFIDDKDYMRQFKEKLKEKEQFSKGPYIDFIDSFKTGKSLKDLISENIVSREFERLFINDNKLLTRNLYKHQEKAICMANENKNLVVTTGTGSGKTESFLFPILNYLMREKEAGELDDGVRALIIYPMNALANDQIKRMRELLKDYQDITFGLYTGETEYKDKDAKAKYIDLNEREPLKNERISRDEMKKRPPHILITNYAMLEYLMLRPSDNVFFHGVMADKWKYIVLDEAHTYTGASGIEVSMLLRRVKNVLNNNEKINFILTSATLGDKKDIKEICDFASRLCSDAMFDSSGVIMADRHSFSCELNYKEYDLNIYRELSRQLEKNNSADEIIKIFNCYGINKEPACDIKELLFELVKQDKNYYKLRKLLLDSPKTINEISKEINTTEEDIINFVEVASKAEKNYVKLLDAKYHMFIRALEGVYISLAPYKRLSIIPSKSLLVNNREVMAYDASVCKFCGQIYIKGYIDNNNRLQQNKNSENENKTYMLLNEINKTNLNEKDLEDLYNICSVCGKIENANSVKSNMCNCGKENINKILEIKNQENIIRKCLACETNTIQGSVLREFYVGQEAATSVVCSGLYEEIPSKKYEPIKTIVKKSNNFFGFDDNDEEDIIKENIIEKKKDKQLIVFSDSRQEAAYFATYFNFTYNNLLKRRLIVEAIRELENYIPKDGIEIFRVVDKLKELYKRYNIEKDEDIEKEVWKTILYEMTCSDRNSLENVGIISFEYDPVGKFKTSRKLGEFIEEDVLSIQRILANSFRKEGALLSPVNDKLTVADREEFLFKGIEISICLNGADKKDYLKSWIPKGKHDNYRSKYIKRTLKCDDKYAIDFLTNIWNMAYLGNDELVMKKANEYVMKVEKFKVKVNNDILNDYNNGNDLLWYCCSQCGRLTVNNINEICPNSKCEGKLKLIDVEKVFKNNHYRNQYINLDIFPMVIKEHTAQLSPITAQKYQKDFINKDINILSCSTTFEMGVDVGELETVFMKNMPPTPANYIQRAGRAGRRSDSVAYSLTFSKLASHDLTYFNEPTRMIKGKIRPPKFKIENEKIIKRHVSAAIIASFWKVYPDKYKNVEEFFEKENFDGLIKYIKFLPNSVLEYIKSFVPKEVKNKIDIWIEELIKGDGILYRELEEYKEEIVSLIKIKEELLLESRSKDVGFKISRVESYISTIKKEDILQFLSRKSIIPKYGFPVDTVELTTSLNKNSIEGFDKGSKLRLQRDLMIAIADYAPGSEVIADGKIYTSSYIKKSNKNREWREYAYGECSDENCRHMNIKIHVDDDFSRNIGTCKSCGKEVDKQGVFLIPEYGFIINNRIKEAKTKKPIRTYLSEIHYVGDFKYQQEKEKIYEVYGRDIKIKSTENDELLILNTSNFYICNKCGYSEVKKKTSIKNKQHKTPYGKSCDQENLIERKLGHKLKTDVVQISINDRLEFDYAISVLYTLLEGASSLLEIERTDISGCIDYRVLSNGEIETIFILFDTVPGGAGHVRRIGKFEREDLKQLFQGSLEIVRQCKCGDWKGDTACYSCLCNYYNQKYHDILKRKYAIEFLSDIIGRF